MKVSAWVKRVFNMLLCVCMVLTVLPTTPLVAWAESSEFTYTVLDDGTAQISGFDSTATEVNIPSTIDGYTVTSIGSRAFYNNSTIQKVVICEGLTSIGDYAFYKCTALQTILLPTTLTSVGNAAFYQCTAMESVQYCGDEAGWNTITFGSNNTELTDAAREYNAVILNLKTVGDFVFSLCSDGTASVVQYTGTEEVVTIPQTVEGYTVNCIAEKAFDGCTALKNITIPKTVTTVETAILSGCTNFETVYYEGSKSEWDAVSVVDNNYMLKYIYFDVVSENTDGDYRYIAHSDGTASIIGYTGTDTALEIPATLGGCAVKAIGINAFCDCDSIQTLTVPEGVTDIRSSAFSCCYSLQSMELPESLNVIESSAFSYCKSLESAVIPANVTSIGYSVFGWCTSLKDVMFFDGPTNVGTMMFQYCSALQTVILPNTLTAIGTGTFYYCGNLEIVDIPAGVTYIGDYAFCECNSLKSVTIPSGVTALGKETFYNSGLTSVSLTNSVTTIDSTAFQYCNRIERVYYGGTEKEWTARNFSCSSSTFTTAPRYYNVTDVKQSGDYIYAVHTDGSATLTDYVGSATDITVPATLGGYAVTVIGDSAFSGSSLKSVVISEGVTAIDSYAFSNCTKLTSVTAADSITTIGDYAFAGCTKLQGITLSEGVTTVGDYAFSECTALEWIVFQENVTAIGKQVTYNATAFKWIYYSGSADEWSAVSVNSTNSVFSGASKRYGITDVVVSAPYIYAISTNGTARIEKYIGSNTSVTVPSEFNGYAVTEIANAAFYKCTTINTLIIPDTVTHIGEGAFSNCTALQSITLPNSILTISGNAFYRCKALQTVDLPDALTVLEEDSFRECTLLENVNLPDTLTTIEACAFIYCESLKQLVIPEGVTSIGSDAFYKCTALETVTIPRSMNTIEQYAFDECSGLTDVYYGAGKEEWDAISIGSYNESLTAATIHYTLSGDINGDGTLSSADARLILEAVIKMNVDAEDVKRGDFNGDGVLDTNDVRHMLKQIIS